MKVKRFVPILAFTMVWFASCSNNTPTESSQWKPKTSTDSRAGGEIASSEAAVKALQIIPGSVVNVERVVTPTRITGWDVTVRMSGEWVLTARIDAMTGGLIEMHGGFSPANFNFAPGAYFVPLSTVSLIIQRRLGADITAWSFEHSSVYNEWVYDLIIRTGDGGIETVTMSAVSRNILSGEGA